MRNLQQDFLADQKIKLLVKKGRLILNSSKQNEALLFRRILEQSIAQGRWAGEMALIS